MQNCRKNKLGWASFLNKVFGLIGQKIWEVGDFFVVSTCFKLWLECFGMMQQYNSFLVGLNLRLLVRLTLWQLREIKRLFIKYNQDFTELERNVGNTSVNNLILGISQIFITLTLWFWLILSLKAATIIFAKKVHHWHFTRS